MWQHLKEAHPGEYFNAKSSGEGTSKSTDLTVDLISNSNDVASSSTNKQMQITEAINRMQPLPHSSQ